jgi:N-acetyl sugar amidotransferase
MLRYCKLCLYPETKPDLQFNADGVCSACTSYRERATVDWNARRSQFLAITDRYRSRNGSNYDCIVPVSGGKDSTYQVVRVLEAGLNALAVTAATDSLSDIGRANIENLKRLGVDHIEVTPNVKLRRQLNRLCLQEVGDISWPEHVAIFTTPVRVAVQVGVPLIIWGENPQNEYGGPAASSGKNVLDRRWLEEFGGLLGFRVADLADQAKIDRKHLIAYIYPDDADLARVGVTGLFLGHYFPWDGLTNALIAQGYGFRTLDTNVEGSLAGYENLDNYYTGIHDYFKYLKYGFGRATDLVNNHIRRGRLSRSDGLALVRRLDGKYPWTYLKRPLADVLAEIDMTIEEFNEVCDRFTNKDLFVCDNSGKPVRDSGSNLIKKTQDY